MLDPAPVGMKSLLAMHKTQTTWMYLKKENNPIRNRMLIYIYLGKNGFLLQFCSVAHTCFCIYTLWLAYSFAYLDSGFWPKISRTTSIMVTAFVINAYHKTTIFLLIEKALQRYLITPTAMHRLGRINCLTHAEFDRFVVIGFTLHVTGVPSSIGVSNRIWYGHSRWITGPMSPFSIVISSSK